MIVILLGLPGAGKGTQAKILAGRLKVAHISTGDLLRQNVSQGTGLGKQAKEFMDKGLLVPDDLVARILQDRLDHPGLEKGFILDGYPRTVLQATALDGMLEAKDRAVDMAVYLEAAEDVIIQRLSGRRVCSVCGSNFHIRNMPPRKEMVCDDCGGRLYHRSDDSPDTIKKRLQVCQEQSHPLLEYYQSSHKLYRVSSNEEPATVLDFILQLIAKRDGSLKV